MRDVLKVLKAAGDESRLRILGMLKGRTLCVCEISEVMGLAQSTVSRHLKILEDSGLVDREKDAQWVEYSLASPPLGSLSGKMLKLVQDVLDESPVIRRDRVMAEQADRNVICQRE